jgi:RNA polymerase sigma-70 factor (ECF subfamily)
MRNILFNEKEEIFKKQTGIDFQTTYTKFYPKLVYYVNNMCKDQQRAEDTTMDAFMQALEKIDKYDRSKSQFSTWLFTIAKNLTLQEIKLNKRSVSIDSEIDSEGTTLKDFLYEDEYNNPTPVDLSDRKAEIIKKVMQDLKEPYKSVIEMREIKKMQYKEISKVLNRNLSTVKSQIRNGRQILINSTKKEFDQIDKMYL